MIIKELGGKRFYLPEVGDKVRVKEWDDMVKEYDVDASGSIIGAGLDPYETSIMSYGPVFTESMRGICGMEFEVKELLPHVGFNYVRAVSPNGTISIRVSSVVLEPVVDKKYELTDEVYKIRRNGVKLFRIKSLRDFSDVRAGQLGGFVECEDNLSQDGDCWIYEGSYVYSGAKVSDNAKVKGLTKVSNGSEIFGNAVVDGGYIESCSIGGNAKTFGELSLENVKLDGEAYVGNSQ